MPKFSVRLCAVLIAVSLVPAGTGNWFSPLHLAPVSNMEQAFFFFSPAQREEAENLIQTLDLVIAYLAKEEESRGPALHPKLDEEDSWHYRYPEKNSERSLIPALLFYHAFGISGLKRLRQDLSAALQPNQSIPKNYPLKLGTPLGPYRFSILTRAIVDTGVIRRVQLNRFRHNDDKNPRRIVAVVSDYNEKGLRAFALTQEKARKAADVLFEKDNPAGVYMDKIFKLVDEFRSEHLRRGASGRAFCEAIRHFAALFHGEEEGNIDSAQRRVLQLGSAYFENFAGPTALHDFHRLFREKEGAELLQALIKLREEIEDTQIALDEKNGRIVRLNLPALRVSGKSDPRVAAGIICVELDLPQLLRMAAQLRPARAIVQEILFRLPVPAVEEEGSVAAVTIGTHEANLSGVIATLPATAFQDPFVFYNLLKILTATHRAAPGNRSEWSELGPVAEVRRNILRALNRGRPNWFQASLQYLDGPPIRIGGVEVDPFETEVAFLAASGWVDVTIEKRLYRERKNAAFVKRVKSLLAKRMAVSRELLEASADHQLQTAPLARPIPFSFSLQEPLHRQRVLNYLKSKIFFGEADLSEALVRLAFLSADALVPRAQGGKTLGEWLNQLPSQLALEKIRQRLQGLYHSLFLSGDASLRSAFILQEETNRAILTLSPPAQNEKSFLWFLRLLQSFLSADQFLDFWRRLVFLPIREHLSQSLSDLSEKYLMPWLEPRIDDAFFPMLDGPLDFLLQRFPKSVGNNDEQQLERHLLEARRLLEAGGRLEGLLRVVRVNDFLSEYKKALHPDGSIEEIKLRLERNLARGRIRAAFAEEREAVLKKIDEAFAEGMELQELWRLGATLERKCLQEIGATFEEDPFLHEIAAALSLPHLLKELLEREKEKESPNPDLRFYLRLDEKPAPEPSGPAPVDPALLIEFSGQLLSLFDQSL